MRSVRFAAALILAGCAAGPAPEAPPSRTIELGSARFLQRDSIASLAFSKDGRTIAAGDAAGNVILWDRATGTAIRTLTGLDGTVRAVALSPDGSRVAGIGGVRGAVWNVADGALVRSVDENAASEYGYGAVAWSPDGRTLAFGGLAQAVLVTDSADGSKTGTWDATQWGAASLAFPEGGAFAAAGDGAGNAHVIDRTSGKPVRSLRDAKARPSWRASIFAVHVSDDGRDVAAVSGAGAALRWRGDTPEPQRIDTDGSEILAAAIASDGAGFAASCTDGSLRVGRWDAPSDVLRLRPAVGAIHAIAFAPDGRSFATGGAEGRVRYWDAGTGAEIDPPSGHAGPVYAVAASPDGKLVATGGRDGTVRLWDAAGSTERIVLTEAGPIRAVAFSADGRLVAAGGWERRITVIDAQSGEVRWTSAALPDDVRAIALVADGTASAVAPADVACPAGHTDRVTAAVTCRGGLLSASWDGTIRRWDVATGDETGRIGVGTEVHALATSPDGILVWAARADGIVAGYPLTLLTAAPRASSR